MSTYFKLLIFVILLSIVVIFAGYYLAQEDGAVYGLLLLFVIILVSGFLGDKITLMYFRTKKISAQANLAVYDSVNRVSKMLQINQPRLYQFENEQPNSFAVKSFIGTGTIVFSSSIFEFLNNKEIEAIISYQLSAIKNKHSFLITIISNIICMVACVLIGTVAILQPKEKDENRKDTLLVRLLILFLVPFVAIIPRIFISKSMVFVNDQSAINACKQPIILASALYKLNYYASDCYNTRFEMVPFSAQLFAVNPIVTRWIRFIFSAHPRIEDRVKRLVDLHKKMYGYIDEEYDFLENKK